jgi:hypothetical protein
MVEAGRALSRPGRTTELVMSMRDPLTLRNMARRAYVMGRKADMIVLGRDSTWVSTARGPVARANPEFFSMLGTFRQRFPTMRQIPRVRAIEQVNAAQRRAADFPWQYQFNGWTPMANIAFMQGAIDGGVPVGLGTGLSGAANNLSSFFARELIMLQQAGYRLQPISALFPHGALTPP